MKIKKKCSRRDKTLRPPCTLVIMLGKIRVFFFIYEDCYAEVQIANEFTFEIPTLINFELRSFSLVVLADFKSTEIV